MHSVPLSITTFVAVIPFKVIFLTLISLGITTFSHVPFSTTILPFLFTISCEIHKTFPMAISSSETCSDFLLLVITSIASFANATLPEEVKASVIHIAPATTVCRMTFFMFRYLLLILINHFFIQIVV